ncbi:hypothetical protein TIFTF001_030371 [Ficus carica]|uniref:Uncharacterized protein n=1 Tax=Ficus carica TaxID=3494 RepID=A0AA88DXH0_FICCA|nr:hypothetical protein TIFTF001_030371 [Ficus carica]
MKPSRCQRMPMNPDARSSCAPELHSVEPPPLLAGGCRDNSMRSRLPSGFFFDDDFRETGLPLRRSLGIGPIYWSYVGSAGDDGDRASAETTAG